MHPRSSFLFASLLLLSAYACSSGDATIASGSSGDDGGPQAGGDGGAGSGSDSGSTGGGDNDGSTSGGDGGDGGTSGGGAIRRVFVVTMENHSWSDIKGSSSAPYINNTLIPMAAHAEQYFTPAGIHPSEPNYIWMEAGGNLGITTDDDPAKNHQSTTDHLVTLLTKAGKTWRAYAEGIDGKSCPLAASGLYAPKHTPMLFFDDVTDTNKSDSASCIQHVRPFTELANDLSANKVADYNFITPNLCNDMHGTTGSFDCPPFVTDLVKTGDTFLSTLVPQIIGSPAFQNGGVLFIVWDEGSGFPTSSDGPVPFFVLGDNVKKGFASQTKYTHSSLLRSVQEIFGAMPFLRDAANAKDLSDLFTQFP